MKLDTDPEIATVPQNMKIRKKSIRSRSEEAMLINFQIIKLILKILVSVG